MLIEKDSFLNFACEWTETPKFLNDSWLMGGNGISEDASGALIAPCTISMYFAKPIEKIEVYEYCFDSDGSAEESVHYDGALLFRCAGGHAFCISCMLNGPGLAEDLHFSEDAATIDKIVNGSTIRMTIQ